MSRLYDIITMFIIIRNIDNKIEMCLNSYNYSISVPELWREAVQLGQDCRIRRGPNHRPAAVSGHGLLARNVSEMEIFDMGRIPKTIVLIFTNNSPFWPKLTI